MILYLGCLGIISGDEKRFLEKYVDPNIFRQRKSFDEYYIDESKVDVDLSLTTLMALSEWFKVSVHSDHVSLTQGN